MPHVFRPAGNGRFADLARALAPEFQAVTLHAPPDGGPEWHDTEPGGGTPFRWSAAARVIWRLPASQGGKRVVQARIPFLMQVRPGFASECTVAIGGRPAAMALREGAIFAELSDVPPTDTELVLQTPSLPTPMELGNGPDTRRLGLALPIAT
jgi:hypothetical protein